MNTIKIKNTIINNVEALDNGQVAACLYIEKAAVKYTTMGNPTIELTLTSGDTIKTEPNAWNYSYTAAWVADKINESIENNGNITLVAEIKGNKRKYLTYIDGYYTTEY